MDSGANAAGASTTECHGDGSMCAECGKLFSHSFYFGTHIVTHLGEKSYEPAGQCGMCGLVFSDAAVYQAHVMALQARLEATAAENKSMEECVQDEEVQEPLAMVAEDEPVNLHHSPQPLPLPKKKIQSQPLKQKIEQETFPPDSPTKVSKQMVKAKPPQVSKTVPEAPESTSLLKPKSEQDVKPLLSVESVTIKREAPDACESGSDDLPRKRLRRAPDKYEVYHEEKKRRAPKRKAMPTTPGYDPEVEKYLQSLRDMGYAVAPDTFDNSQGSQGSRGRDNPAKRGRGTPRGRGGGRGMQMAPYAPVPPRQTLAPPTRPLSNFSTSQRGRGVRGAFLPPRGMASANAPTQKASPNVMMRNPVQNFQPRPRMVEPRRDIHAGVAMDRTSSMRGFHSPNFGSHVLYGRTNQQVHKPSSKPSPKPSPSMTMNYRGGVNNRVAPVAVPPPFLITPKAPRVAYYDEEDEIVSLINGDLEIMPRSGKATRGERLKQRQDRVSVDGTVESPKKSVKYFPQTEKPKTKKSPKKVISPSNKHYQTSSLRKPETNSAASGYSMANDIRKGTIQITNVHSLQPVGSSQRARRGSRARGRQGRWMSNPQFPSIQATRTMPQLSSFKGQTYHQPHQQPPQDPYGEAKEYVTNMGTVRNIEGRMEDLREEARKKVEDMLASPAAFLEHALAKPLGTFSVPRRSRHPLAIPKAARGRSRGRGRSSRGRGRGRGATSRSVPGQRVRGGHIVKVHLDRRPPQLRADDIVDLEEEERKIEAARRKKSNIETGPAQGVIPAGDQPKGTDEDQPKGNDEDQPKGNDEDQPKGNDEDQPKGNDEDQSKGNDEDQNRGTDEDPNRGEDEDQNRGGDADKEDILEGENIDGWKVSISTLSDSDEEENNTKEEKTEKEGVANSGEVCKDDESKSMDGGTIQNRVNSEAVMTSTEEKTKAPDGELETDDQLDSEGKSNLETTDKEEAGNHEPHENTTHKPRIHCSEDKEKGINSPPSVVHFDSVLELAKAEGTSPCGETKTVNSRHASDKDVAEKSVSVEDISVDTNERIKDPTLGSSRGSFESSENFEETPDTPAHSFSPSSSNTHENTKDTATPIVGITSSEKHHDDRELDETKNNSLPQQLDSISPEINNLDGDGSTSENISKKLPEESDLSAEMSKGSEYCDVSDEAETGLEKHESTPLTKLGSDCEGENKDDSGILPARSSDLKNKKPGENLGKETFPSACVKGGKADGPSHSTPVLSDGQVTDSEESKLGTGSETSSQNVMSVHEDKAAGERQGQRFESENGYEETDNFSEIEKTCQEIIRDVENQEEERRAHFESS